MRLAGLLLSLAPFAHAAALAVSVDTAGSSPVASWSGGDAALYRVAVLSPADKEGKRATLAAAWVSGTAWTYGSKAGVLPKAGKLPSVESKPLAPGVEYRLMVRPAKADGTYTAEWSARHFKLEAAAAEAALPTEEPSPSFTPTPLVEASANTLDAELEVDLAADFKETPEAAEGAKAPTPTPVLTPSFESARALLQAGKAEPAEAVYKSLLDSDAESADAWEGLGDSYDARKMKVEAKEAYEKALSLDKSRDRLKKWLEENVRK